MAKKKSGLENLVLITQLGLNLITTVFLCLFIGLWIDKRFGTNTVLAFLILGIVSGSFHAYKMAKRTIDKEKDEKGW